MSGGASPCTLTLLQRAGLCSWPLDLAEGLWLDLGQPAQAECSGAWCQIAVMLGNCWGLGRPASALHHVCIPGTA